VDVINIATQDSVDWRNLSEAGNTAIIHAEERFPTFANAIQNIVNPLSRSQVLDAFSQSYYQGFIATLLWGGMHSAHASNFYRALGENQDNINNRFEQVHQLLTQEDVVGAYHYIARKSEAHIPGIGVTYISKLLFFLSSGIVFNHCPRPLILDSHLIYSHCAILFDSEHINHRDYYLMRNDSLAYKNGMEEVTYFEYIRRMSAICEEFGIISPDKLELALFEDTGIDDNNNPRFVSKRYALEHFND